MTNRPQAAGLVTEFLRGALAGGAGRPVGAWGQMGEGGPPKNEAAMVVRKTMGV